MDFNVDIFVLKNPLDIRHLHLPLMLIVALTRVVQKRALLFCVQLKHIHILYLGIIDLNGFL